MLSTSLGSQSEVEALSFCSGVWGGGGGVGFRATSWARCKMQSLGNVAFRAQCLGSVLNVSGF